jgi:hypothetical protein
MQNHPDNHNQTIWKQNILAIFLVFLLSRFKKLMFFGVFAIDSTQATVPY